MARYQTSVRTPWKAADAFEYMSDLSNFSEWDPGIERSVLVEGEPGTIGSVYDLTISAVRDTVMRYEIVATDHRARVEARSTTSTLASTDVVTVSSDGGGSIVTYDADVRLRGLLRLGDPVFALVFRRIGDRAARGLATRLDGTIV